LFRGKSLGKEVVTCLVEKSNGLGKGLGLKSREGGPVKGWGMGLSSSKFNVVSGLRGNLSFEEGSCLGKSSVPASEEIKFVSLVEVGLLEESSNFSPLFPWSWKLSSRHGFVEVSKFSVWDFSELSVEGNSEHVVVNILECGGSLLNEGNKPGGSLVGLQELEFSFKVCSGSFEFELLVCFHIEFMSTGELGMELVEGLDGNSSDFHVDGVKLNNSLDGLGSKSVSFSGKSFGDESPWSNNLINLSLEFGIIDVCSFEESVNLFNSLFSLLGPGFIEVSSVCFNPSGSKKIVKESLNSLGGFDNFSDVLLGSSEVSLVLTDPIVKRSEEVLSVPGGDNGDLSESSSMALPFSDCIGDSNFKSGSPFLDSLFKADFFNNFKSCLDLFSELFNQLSFSGGNSEGKSQSENHKLHKIFIIQSNLNTTLN
jgi:hypothetical protein